MNKELNYKSLLKIVVIGILVYCGIQNYPIILGILAKLLSLLFPFILGGAIAFIINVPMSGLEKRLFPKKENVEKIRRVLAYILTLLLITATIGLALFVIIPQISDTIMLIVKQVPSAFKAFQQWIYVVTDQLPTVQAYIEKLNINWSSLSSYAVQFLKSAGTTVFSSGISVVSGIVGGITNFVVAFIFSIYILLQKEKLSTQGKKVLFAVFKENKADRILYIGRLANKIFSNFLSGQCIEAVILGTMFFITLSLFHIPYALLIGVIISLTALIPIFGAFIGCAIGAFLLVMVDPMQALWFVIIFLVLQQIENNLIYPHVVGGSIGLPSIWVLVAVMIGGNLFGVTGILIFIPLCSVFYSLFREYVYKRLNEKKISSDKWEIVEDIQPEDTKSRNKKSKKQTSNKEEREETPKKKTEDKE
ncbi:MAG: AI-2E family transporter [Lachnospiraceae bacterium]